MALIRAFSQRSSLQVLLLRPSALQSCEQLLLLPAFSPTGLSYSYQPASTFQASALSHTDGTHAWVSASPCT